MKIKIRKENKDGIVRLETAGTIKEILINEDFFHPKTEIVSICFRGQNSSGIIEANVSELDHIYSILKKRTHLIKGIKKFRVEKE
ncbi:MAG: hypothetical protein AABW81_00595 [Nanoarchaeota archaeon]|mgnify:CR=1 FL=1